MMKLALWVLFFGFVPAFYRAGFTDEYLSLFDFYCMGCGFCFGCYFLEKAEGKQ